MAKKDILVAGRIAVVALLLHVFCESCTSAVAFVPSFSTGHGTTTSSFSLYVSRAHRRIQKRQRSRHVLYATSASTPTKENAATTEFYDTATQLLDLLLEKRTQDIESPLQALLRRNSQSNQELENERNNNIEALIEKLTFATLGESKQQQDQKGFQSFFDNLQPKPTYYYDPTESLFGGGFYCTLYFYYPNSASDSNGEPPEDPIWEKTSLKASNIKGQQYYIRNDFQQSVINYSEVWGPSVTISAEGVLTPIDGDGKDQQQESSMGKKTKKDSRSLRRLPDVFRVDATKISASIFGLNLNFNISGSANLVVLYADPRIRVFVSPLASETVVGNWEEAGLVVVQVRGDLVPPENESIPQVIDLR